MVCRHRPNDPACSSFGHSKTPDADNYEILEVRRIGANLILRVRYPNCAKAGCFEGEKVLVYLRTLESEALKWKRIDPHFRSTQSVDSEAPSPDARFPPTPKGWESAVTFASLPDRWI